jgi:hypothetical protein
MIAARIRTQAAKFSLSFMVSVFDELQWQSVRSESETDGLGF